MTYNTDPAASLAALRKLALMAPPEDNNPIIKGSLDQRDRIDEMRRNLAKSGNTVIGGKVTSGFASGATPEDVTQAEADQDEDPMLGVAARDAARKQQDVYQAGVAYEQPEAQKMRADEAQTKMAIAAAPAEAAARGSALEERIKQTGALDLMKQKQSGESELVKMFSRGGEAGGDGGAVNNVKMTLGPNGPGFQQIPITNQTRQMSETSNDILDLLDKSDYEGQARSLQQKGLFQPGIGIARRYLSQHGLGTVAGVDAQTASDMGQFETTHDLLLSAIARAHAGARGAGNTGMAERFDKLLASQGDLPTFVGQLKGMRGLLETYAKHTRNRAGVEAAPATATDDLGTGF